MNVGQLSGGALRLVKTLARTEDYSMKIVSRDNKFARELQLKGIIFITPLAMGGAELSLTKEGRQFVTEGEAT